MKWKEKKSSQIWQFSCHKELEVGINRHHRPLTNCAKSTFFPGFKINKIQIKKSLGKCKMELFYCRNIFYNLKEIFEVFGEIEFVDSSPQDDV